MEHLRFEEALSIGRYSSTAMLTPCLGGVLEILADIASKVLSHAISA